MKQYHCCKHHQNCSLYHICKDMNKEILTSPCKRDCATCDYEGCTMPQEQRLHHPLFVNGFTYETKIPLPIERIREQERQFHKKNHFRNYEFYNKLFGDYRERRNKQQRERYWRDSEFARQRAREWYRKNYKKKQVPIREEIMPECQFQCECCEHQDCILPENWRKKVYMQIWKEKNPDYYAKYREKNRELLREKSREYNRTHREERRVARKIHRSKPEVKAQRAEYDKKYKAAHPEKEAEKKKRYRERHPERIREYKRKYYEKNKAVINQKRREARARNHQLREVKEPRFPLADVIFYN